MKKKIYICDICNNQFKVSHRGYRSYVGMEIHLKYEDELDFRKCVKIDICPYCLNEIRDRSKGMRMKGGAE